MASRALETQKTIAFKQHTKRYDILMEYRSLQAGNHCPSGIYVLPSPESLSRKLLIRHLVIEALVWNGVIFLHSGPYAGAVLRFIITFPEEYPQVVPSVRFMSDVYHPLVNSNGHFIMQQFFPVWRPNYDFVIHVLLQIKRAFTNEGLNNLDASLTPNVAALEHYKNTPIIFEKMCKNTVDISNDDANLYAVEYHLKISKITDSKYDAFVAKLKSGNMKQLTSPSGPGFFTSDIRQEFKSGLTSLFQSK